jgi:endoglucanase
VIPTATVAATQSTPGVQLLGVNLSGAEYGNPVTGRLGYDYIYPTKTEIDYFASLGLNTIRIPVSWQRLQPTENGPLSTTQLTRLQTLVAYAATKGITVDIDLHNYGAGWGADVGTTQTPDSVFANFWSQMAAYFKNAPNVIFGLMNEPNSQTPANWAIAAQDAVNAIRATGATQEILVSGSDWDTASSWVSSGNAATVGAITDPLNNLVFEVHQYFNPGSTGTNTHVISPNIGPQSLAAVTQWAAANGRKLFLGEFGSGSDPLSLTALGNTLNYLNANAGVWQGGTYWAGGPWMGHYMFSADRQNGAEAPQTAVLAAATAQSLTLFSATKTTTTTNTASAMPFSGVIITGANAAQTMTATVTLSSTLNRTLSDPNAATDGSRVVNGVWGLSGSSASIAAALDGLVFTPGSNLAGAKGAVSTTVTAVFTYAGETASATSTITTGVATPIAITPVSRNIATTDSASVVPFAGVAITDANMGQAETLTVASSTPANGTLSDPHAAADGSTVVNGLWTVSGSAADVVAALKGLVFTPTAGEVVPNAAVATTLTATIKDTAGRTASAASNVIATQSVSTLPTDTIVLNMSEDYRDGDAAFTVAVNGQQVGGDIHAHALHASGDAGMVSLTGNWGSGVNDVTVSFINHASGRNLYVNSITENGLTYAGTSAAMPRNGNATFAVGGTTPTEAAPADTLTLQLSENAYKGDALFVLYVDGHAVTTPQVVTALHDANQTQGFTFAGNWGAGPHTIGVACVNNGYGPSPGEQRSLYIDGITLNGSDVFSGPAAQQVMRGIASFSVTTTH